MERVLTKMFWIALALAVTLTRVPVVSAGSEVANKWCDEIGMRSKAAFTDHDDWYEGIVTIKTTTIHGETKEFTKVNYCGVLNGNKCNKIPFSPDKSDTLHQYLARKLGEHQIPIKHFDSKYISKFPGNIQRKYREIQNNYLEFTCIGVIDMPGYAKVTKLDFTGIQANLETIHKWIDLYEWLQSQPETLCDYVTATVPDETNEYEAHYREAHTFTRGVGRIQKTKGSVEALIPVCFITTHHLCFPANKQELMAAKKYLRSAMELDAYYFTDINVTETKYPQSIPTSDPWMSERIIKNWHCEGGWCEDETNKCTTATAGRDSKLLKLFEINGANPSVRQLLARSSIFLFATTLIFTLLV